MVIEHDLSRDPAKDLVTTLLQSHQRCSRINGPPSLVRRRSVPKKEREWSVHIELRRFDDHHLAATLEHHANEVLDRVVDYPGRTRVAGRLEAAVDLTRRVHEVVLDQQDPRSPLPGRVPGGLDADEGAAAAHLLGELGDGRRALAGDPASISGCARPARSSGPASS